MPRVYQELIFNNFTGGLNTEAGPFNFPENAVSEISNLDISLDGSVKRRLGLDTEGSGVEINVTGAYRNDYAFSSYVWKDINNDPLLARSVIQVGDTLYFLDAKAAAQTADVKATFVLPFGFDLLGYVAWVAERNPRRRSDVGLPNSWSGAPCSSIRP